MNMLKPTRSDDHHQIIDFLRASHIRYALSHGPIIFDSLVKQFWSTATLRSPELADDGGIDDLPIAEIYSGMDNLGPIAVALICLSDGRRFNWSSYIFKGMVSNIGNAKKFLMYPRFLQAILGVETRIKRHYKVLMFSSKLFANMRLNFTGHPMPLLPAMLLQAQAGQPSGGAEDPITLTDLSSVVSTLVQKVNSLDTELKDHKKFFKDVVGKLVTKVKAMEAKLKTKKRKMVVSNFDQEDDEKQDVDLDALRALANAAVTIDSNIPPGGASHIPAASTSVLDAVPTGASTVPAGSPSVPANVPPSVAPAGVSNKGKSQMVEEDIHVKERTFKQMQEDILELQRQRQQEVLNLAMYYTEADWINIKAQMEANASLSKTLLGDDVSEDNFLARMAALIKRKKQALAEKLVKERQDRPMTQAQQRTYMRQFVKNQSCAVYSIGWSMARVKSFTDDQLKEEFEKIQKAISNIQIQAFSRTLKRTGPVFEEPSSKRQKSTKAPIPFVPEAPQSPVISSPISSGTRRKSLGKTHLTKPKSKLRELDLDADDQTFIKVITTPLGDINALYRIDRSTKHFTTLRQILHMVDREDLVKLHGLVVKYYENHPVAGAGLILWGDLQVLFDSHKGGKGSFVWQNQHLWEIRSWRLYTLSNVHLLETVSKEVVFMFADVSYPLSVKLMERMLTHKLEIDTDVMGNDMTTAEQLIQFIKNQLAAA
nr:aminoacyl-tRNA synthetase, class 1a, anticodon-binding [Tanacetum cinerariifolium]